MRAPVPRRDFLHRFVVGSVASVLAGKLSISRALASILPGPIGTLKVKVSDYPALLAAGGSIQLQFSGATPHPLMINRGPGNTFYALDSDCQHQHCTVPPYSAATGVIRCACHGSRYAIDGALVGGPATRGLNTFTCAFDGADTLAIQIPGLFFTVGEIALHPGAPNRRLKLTFNILPFSTFQVFFQENLTDARQPVAFSTIDDGPANSTSAFTPVSPATIWVDPATPTRGFYTIALVASLYASSSLVGAPPPAAAAKSVRRVAPRKLPRVELR